MSNEEKPETFFEGMILNRQIEHVREIDETGTHFW